MEKRTFTKDVNMNHARDQKVAALIYLQQLAENETARSFGRAPHRLFKEEVMATAIAALNNMVGGSFDKENYVDTTRDTPFLSEFALLLVPRADVLAKDEPFRFFHAHSHGIQQLEILPAAESADISIPASLSLGQTDRKLSVVGEYRSVPLEICREIQTVFGLDVTNDRLLTEKRVEISVEVKPVADDVTLTEQQLLDGNIAFVGSLIAANSLRLLDNGILTAVANKAETDSTLAKALAVKGVQITCHAGAAVFTVVTEDTY